MPKKNRTTDKAQPKVGSSLYSAAWGWRRGWFARRGSRESNESADFSRWTNKFNELHQTSPAPPQTIPAHLQSSLRSLMIRGSESSTSVSPLTKLEAVPKSTESKAGAIRSQIGATSETVATTGLARGSVDDVSELLKSCLIVLDDAPGSIKASSHIGNVREMIVEARKMLSETVFIASKLASVNDFSGSHPRLSISSKSPEFGPEIELSELLSSSGILSCSSPRSLGSLNVLAPSDSVGVQTEPPAEMADACCQTFAGKPPRIPRNMVGDSRSTSIPPLSPKSVDGASSRSSRSQSGGNRQRVEDGVGYASIYEPTPLLTCMFEVDQCIRHWNPVRHENDCCPYHVCLNRTIQACRRLSGKACQPLWSCYTGWQCNLCFAVNEKSVEFCEVCTGDKPPSACHAENDQVLSEIESDAYFSLTSSCPRDAHHSPSDADCREPGSP